MKETFALSNSLKNKHLKMMTMDIIQKQVMTAAFGLVVSRNARPCVAASHLHQEEIYNTHINIQSQYGSE